ncbi:uncharacterized protein LOC141764374 [Sebastes fasciatus]|uniref:uncharacterized protein LOC141764374 n=1 Tax=Sebastes fasciatus TaxID=394691 RepID=UPI003D9DC50C
MEPFYHLPPSSTTRDLPSRHTPSRRLDLQAITDEWLSLTLEPSASTPAHSLTTTPVPPTPPPLPTDLAPLLREPISPSPAPSQRGFALPPQRFPITPPGRLGHTPAVLPFSQPPPPPPPPPPLPHSSFTPPLPDSSLRYNIGKGIAQSLHISKPEILSCTVPEPIKSPTEVSLRHKSNVEVNKSSKIPDVKLQVKDPYDELLSMILDGSTSTCDSDFSRLPPVDSNESRSRFKLKAEESHQPAVKPPEVPPANDSAVSARLEVQFHKPVTMEPLSVSWGGQSKTLNEQPVEPQRPPSVKGRGYTELFIEEEDEAIEDTVEDVKGFNERLSPQAGVSPSTLTRLPHCSLPSPSIPPPLTSLPPPSPSSSSSFTPSSPSTSSFTPSSPSTSVTPSSSSVSRSQQQDRITLPPSPPVSPRPPSLPHLMTSPSPPVSPTPLHCSHASPNVPSQRSVFHISSSPYVFRPVTSRPDSESPIPLPALTSPKPASPPLTTPRSPPTVPPPGHRSPKVKVKLECGDDAVDFV